MDLERWYRIPIDLRARMLAHEIERSLRHGYREDRIAGGGKTNTGANARDAMFAAWGLQA